MCRDCRWCTEGWKRWQKTASAAAATVLAVATKMTKRQTMTNGDGGSLVDTRRSTRKFRTRTRATTPAACYCRSSLLLALLFRCCSASVGSDRSQSLPVIKWRECERADHPISVFSPPPPPMQWKPKLVKISMRSVTKWPLFGDNTAKIFLLGAQFFYIPYCTGKDNPYHTVLRRSIACHQLSCLTSCWPLPTTTLANVWSGNLTFREDWRYFADSQEMWQFGHMAGDNVDICRRCGCRPVT